MEDHQKILWTAVRRALLGLVGSIFVVVRAVEQVYGIKAAKVPTIEAPERQQNEKSLAQELNHS